MKKGEKTKELWKNPEYREHMKKVHLGQTAWNKGKKTDEKTREKLSISHLGIQANEKHPHWKGNNASYVSIHHWVRRWKGKPKLCENCGTKTAKKYEWSNIDHKYRRVLEDYIRMCTKCHFEYDRDILKSIRGRKPKNSLCLLLRNLK